MISSLEQFSAPGTTASTNGTADKPKQCISPALAELAGRIGSPPGPPVCASLTDIPESAHGMTRPATRQRKESPVERAARLVSQWGHSTAVTPDTITAFTEHTQRPVTINHAGKIEFTHEGKKLAFAHAEALSPGPKGLPSRPASRLPAYCHPDDPTYLYLTGGRGAIVGVWLQRARLDAMREHHRALLADHGFVDVARLSDGTRNMHHASHVANGQTGVIHQRAPSRSRRKRRGKITRNSARKP